MKKVVKIYKTIKNQTPTSPQLHELKEGLDYISFMLSKMEEGELIVYCSETGEALFSKLPNNRETKIKSHGKCFDCEEWFSIESLQTAEDIGRSPWPVRYIGYSCEPCYNKPIETDEPI